MRRRTALSTVVGLMLALASPVLAQDDGESNGVLLIMDASGSMGRVDDQGVRLIDGAKGALDALVTALPEGAPIGLRVYGHRVPNTDKANGCTDTELVVPVGPLRHDEMRSAIDSFDARGFTPIGLSLMEAADDLNGAGTIVLVSDGEDTCAPPEPCEVAAELLAAGIDVRVETIGFFLEDDAAREQLQCIAATTGGSFREVGSIDVLAAEMGVLVGQSIPEVGRLHLPLSGGATAATATPTPLRPPFEGELDGGYTAFEGAYETTLAPRSTEWFRVDIDAGAGLRVHGRLHGLVDAAPEGTLEITILDVAGNDATRQAPRRGVAVANIASIDQPDSPYFGAGNHTGFHPWEMLEPEEVANLIAQGYDEERYNQEWLAAALAPLEDPPPAGPYAVGFTWHSDQEGGQLHLGWALSITAQPVELYGQVYERLDGGPAAAAAVAFGPPEQALHFNAYNFPPGDYGPGFRSYHVGTMRSGETSWYHQTMDFDHALVVEAFAVDANGQPIADGSLDLGIFDSDMASIEHAIPVTAALDPSGTGILAAVSMVDDGVGDPPPSSDDGAWLAVTWTSPTDEATEVRMIVDVTARYPNSSAPSPSPTPTASPSPSPTQGESEPSENAAQPAEATEETGRADEPSSDGSGGRSGLLIAAVLVASTAGAFVVVRSIRRRR